MPALGAIGPRTRRRTTIHWVLAWALVASGATLHFWAWKWHGEARAMNARVATLNKPPLALPRGSPPVPLAWGSWPAAAHETEWMAGLGAVLPEGTAWKRIGVTHIEESKQLPAAWQVSLEWEGLSSQWSVLSARLQAMGGCWSLQQLELLRETADDQRMRATLIMKCHWQPSAGGAP
jgi:hypothetical protein